MPVNATIPLTQDFLQTTGTYPLLTELIQHPTNGYLYGCYTEAGVGKILKLKNDDYTDVTVASLPVTAPIDMHYSATNDRFYVVYRTTNSPVTEVHPTTLAMVAFFSITSVGGQGAITGDTANLYVATFSTQKLYSISLATGLQVGLRTMPATGYAKINCLRYFSPKLYALSMDVDYVQLSRIVPATLGTEEVSTPIGIDAGEVPVDDMGESASHIYVGNRDLLGIIRKFSKTDFLNPELIETTQLSKCTCVKTVGPYVWAAFENGRGVRINPANIPDRRIYTLNDGEGYHSEFTGLGSEFVHTYNLSTSKIQRYHIPPDIVPGFLAWAKMQGCEGGHVFMRGAVVDVEGNIYMAGYFTGDLTIGSFEISSNFFGSIFVAKFDSSGNALIVKKFSATGNQVGAVYLTIDSARNLVLVGNFQGTLNFEGTSSPISNTGTSHVYVAKLSGQTLLGIWAKEFSGATYGPVVTDAVNDVYIAPSLGVVAVFDSFTLTKPSGVDPDFGLVKLNRNTGLTEQAQRIGGSGSDIANSIAIGPDGNIVIAGSYDGEINLGGGNRTFSGGIFDLFVAKYTPTGDWLNDRTFGSSGTDTATSVTIHPVSGNIIIAGSLGGAVNFGTGSVGADGGGYIAGFSPDLNTNYWVKETGDGSTGVTSVKVDGNGRLTLMGQARAAINWGIFPTNQAIGSNGQENAFITAFSLTGNNAPVYRNWTIYLGRQGTGQTNGTSRASPGLAISGAEIIAAGQFQFTEDFGGVEHTAPGVSYYSGFLAKYAF